MEVVNDMFLEALRASLKNEQVAWEREITPGDWQALFRMAEIHHVLPLIYNAVYSCPSAASADPQLFMFIKKRVIHQVMLQTIKTSEFLTLSRHLCEAGVKPCVVKGIICRNLYPNPDYRLSGDEDILISEEQFAVCHEAMLAYGMKISDSGIDIQTACEVPYGKTGSPLYIELHKKLFPPESEAYGNLNEFFDDIENRIVKVTVENTEVWTMEPTDHLFYLICHAFKHFLHSGFGIRQVCDIVLFANTYGEQIDWRLLLHQCRKIRADIFAAALFQIGEKYLVFDLDQAQYPNAWKRIQVDEGDMLQELLESGVFGDVSMSRKHSSTITLEAVSAQKTGRKIGNGVWKTAFPPAKDLENRYPYLRKMPVLLPVAWADRIWKYRKETMQTENNSAAESVRIGNQRIQLLKKYGIIK